MKDSKRRAIALGFEAGRDLAPVVEARGEQEIAQEMVRTARRYGIPIHQEPALVEELAHVQRDTEIPEKLYDRVAEVLVGYMKAGKPKTPLDTGEKSPPGSLLGR